jgi:capsule polysaccharide export protein KpsC/LpsZ
MSRKRIKARVEKFYTLTSDACDALGIKYDEERPATMAEIIAAQQKMQEGKPQCMQSTETEKAPKGENHNQ